MCGINGIYKFTDVNENDIAKIQAMNQEMIYRGPNENDTWSDSKVAFGMVRLSIIGVDNGHQPIFNEDNSIVIICNGEIYNYKELRQELESEGHIFKTNSDTEVIIHLYEKKGIKCLNDLRGMFAFAIWDKNIQQMFIARDRVGKKPLYYLNTSEGIIFSSELKAIRKSYIDKVDFNFNEIRNILKYSYPQELNETFVKGVNRIAGGEYALIKNNKLSINRYWKKINTYCFNGSFNNVKSKTLELLNESVKLRLRSDVPLAILLSGGIDSSAVACLAREYTDDLHAITVGYKGNHKCDETDAAERLCREKGITLHKLELDSNDFKDYFAEYVQYIDEPICDVAAVPQWGMYKKAKEEGFTVLLNGNGGDEIFYGYPIHNKDADFDEFSQKLKSILPLNSASKFRKLFRFFFRDRHMIKALLSEYTPNHLDNVFKNVILDLDFDWPDQYELYNPPNFDIYNNSEKYCIDKIYAYLFNVWMQTNGYHKSDRLGMAHSLEVRSPFADNMLIEFVSSLPLEYKYKKGNAKWLLKETLRGVVPDYILDASKRGYTPPYIFIKELVESYESEYFKTDIKHFNQMLVDKLLASYQNNSLESNEKVYTKI